jgi:S1-C subfamily serine protease
MRTVLPWLLVVGLLWRLGQAGAAPEPAPAVAAPGFADAIARAEPSIVHVSVQTHASSARSRDDGVGSGFVFASDGVILASRHVVAGARTVLVEVAGRPPVEGQVLGHDESVDLTVLRVPLQGLTPLALGDSRTLRTGDWVLSAGSPFRLPRSWSAGIVSGLHRTQVAVEPRAYEDFIQTDAAANLGNSGGPLLDAQGRAVGVLTQILTRSGGFQGISLATPIEAVVAAARRILHRGNQPPPTLGIVVEEPPAAGGRQGVLITRFLPGSAAQAAGLKVGDVILSIDGRRTATTAAVQDALRPHTAGETVRVAYLRAGVPGEVQVMLT